MIRRPPRSTPKSTPVSNKLNNSVNSKRPRKPTSKTPYDKFDSEDDDEEENQGKQKKRSAGGAITPRSRRPQRPRVMDDDMIPLTGVMGKIQQVIKRVRGDEWAWPFNAPVDVKALNIPDYLIIIKHPMDLGTVWANLNEGGYSTPEEVKDDVELTFKNAKTYNLEGSDIVVMAENLWAKFQNYYASSVDKNALTGQPLLSFSVPNDPNLVPNQTTKSDDKVMHTATTPNPRRPQRTAPPKEELMEMTFEEKRELSTNVGLLNSDEAVNNVVDIIKRMMPSLHFALGTDGEFELDIDALNTATLRALDKYVKSVLFPSKRGNKGKTSAVKNQQKKLTSQQEKLMQADLTAAQTEKNIQDVRKKLEELQTKSATGNGKPANTTTKKNVDGEEIVDIDDDRPSTKYPSVDIPKDEDSSSDSSSGSDSSSNSDSSSSDSDSSSDEEGPQGPVPQLDRPPIVGITSKVESVTEVESIPVDEKSNTSPAPIVTKAVPEALPTILQPTTNKKDVDLKNVDSWTNLGAPSFNDESDKSTSDATWSAFQNKDLQKKQREKDAQEKEEEEKKKKEEEKKKQDELRLKEQQEEEERKKKEEEEAKQAAQRELEEKRAAERKAREQSSRSVNMLEQSNIMSSFERSGGSDSDFF
eukprot:TRINITY_DN8534_c0_g1_i1.p1 TRINITY_DN8534_c0_g1~~TRINITY_DN8534_c0_g1_i1.p1  ORF type:complete len:643 (-),score=167.59 TRINITY_DN8534_c0_g1_i1:602-2530(-)